MRSQDEEFRQLHRNHRIWLSEYLENCEHLNKSEHTILNYRTDLLKFLRWYESHYLKSIAAINSEVVGAYKDFLSKGGSYYLRKKGNHKTSLKSFFYRVFHPFSSLPLSQIQSACNEDKITQLPLHVSTRRRHLSSLKNFFEYLKQTHEDQGKLFKTNPVKMKIHGIKLKDVDVEHTKMLTPSDWKKLDQTIYKIKDRTILYLLYWGGLRLSELTNLQIEDLDFEHMMLRLKRKGGSLHELVPEKKNQLFQLLQSYCENMLKRNSGPLFPGRTGQSLTTRAMSNSIMNMFKKAGCSAGLGPHSFRKACATNLYLKTKDLLLVRDYLNHTDAKVTQTYIDKAALSNDREYKSSPLASNGQNIR